MLFCPRLVMERGSLGEGLRTEKGRGCKSEAAVKNLVSMCPHHGAHTVRIEDPCRQSWGQTPGVGGSLFFLFLSFALSGSFGP